jgi:hypothetical protein
LISEEIGLKFLVHSEQNKSKAGFTELDPDVWIVDPHQVKRERLFVLMTQLADVFADFKIDRDFEIFNPLVAGQLRIKVSRSPGKSLKLKLSDANEDRTFIRSYPNDFNFFNARGKVLSRICVLLDELVRRKGNLLTYLFKSIHAPYYGSSFSFLDVSKMRPGLALIVYLYMTKIRDFPESPDFDDLRRFWSSPPVKVEGFFTALEGKVRDFFDPALKRFSAPEIGEVYRFYQSISTALAGHQNLDRLTWIAPNGWSRLSISGKVDSRTRSLFFNEALARVQAELELRRFLGIGP